MTLLRSCLKGPVPPWAPCSALWPNLPVRACSFAAFPRLDGSSEPVDLYQAPVTRYTAPAVPQGLIRSSWGLGLLGARYRAPSPGFWQSSCSRPSASARRGERVMRFQLALSPACLPSCRVACGTTPRFFSPGGLSTSPSSFPSPAAPSLSASRPCLYPVRTGGACLCVTATALCGLCPRDREFRARRPLLGPPQRHTAEAGLASLGRDQVSPARYSAAALARSGLGMPSCAISAPSREIG